MRCKEGAHALLKEAASQKFGAAPGTVARYLLLLRMLLWLVSCLLLSFLLPWERKVQASRLIGPALQLH